jgi:hypothetical protein
VQLTRPQRSCALLDAYKRKTSPCSRVSRRYIPSFSFLAFVTSIMATSGALPRRIVKVSRDCQCNYVTRQNEKRAKFLVDLARLLLCSPTSRQPFINREPAERHPRLLFLDSHFSPILRSSSTRKLNASLQSQLLALVQLHTKTISDILPLLLKAHPIVLMRRAFSSSNCFYRQTTPWLHPRFAS